MEIIKKLITFFLLSIITFIYLYFFTCNLYNSLKDKTFNSDYYVSDIQVNEKIALSNTFKQISNEVYSDAVKSMIYSNNKYDSNYILDLIDKNLDGIMNEVSGSFSEEKIRNDMFLYLTSMYDIITSNDSSIDFYIINEIFSYSVLKIFFIIVCILLLLLLVLTKDFLWIKNNGVALLISSFSFSTAWYIIGLILSVDSSLLLSKIFMSVLDVTYKINFSYCSMFFTAGIISLIVYFVFLRLFNIKKHNI